MLFNFLIKRFNVFEAQFLIFKSSYQFLIYNMLFSIFKVNLCVNIIGMLLIKLGFELFLNDLAYGYSDSENVELSMIENLIP